MYWFVDGLCFAAGIGLLGLSIAKKRKSLCLAGLVWMIVYPVFLESLINSFSIGDQKTVYSVDPQSRIVYHPSYNIAFGGLEKMHPFDSQKYKNIYQKLVKRGLVRQEDVIVPDKPSRSFLLEKMNKWYLLKLCYSYPVCQYLEMPLYFLPSFLLRWRVLDPMMRGTEGSVLAAIAADQLGWAINLSGGFHHANMNEGGGFCIYPDITMIVHYLRTRMGKRRIMIVDLDAHQGNGHERDHMGDSEVFIVDFYNHRIYPYDYEAALAIGKDERITKRTTDDDYINKMKGIESDMDDFRPEFVIYNAGTDILDGDPLGRLHISPKGIIRRDQTMIQMCLRRKVPVVMLLSGGYQLVNAEIIADSIENMLKKFG